jgi:PAS domain S-box-containing protein
LIVELSLAPFVRTFFARACGVTEAIGNPGQIEELVASPDLAGALESKQFRSFLDQIPIAIVVAEMKSDEHIVYANPEFQKLSGKSSASIEGHSWEAIQGEAVSDGSDLKLGEALVNESEYVGTFRIERPDREPSLVDAYSNVIVDDNGRPAFRLAALVDVTAHDPLPREEFDKKLREKDTLLREIQHRVKNNLQMITALIRLEARNAVGKLDTAPFDRLAGRIESLQLLYKSLSEDGDVIEIDLGTYLSQIASGVMNTHAVEGIRLDLKVDAYPVSVNVAMPTGLVVNELLTNSLKHAFNGRDAGTITLHCLTDDVGCRVTVEDDGVGLPDGREWPESGKLGALIVQSLRENAKARVEVTSAAQKGTRVTIFFTRAAAAPEPPGQH